MRAFRRWFEWRTGVLFVLGLMGGATCCLAAVLPPAAAPVLAGDRPVLLLVACGWAGLCAVLALCRRASAGTAGLLLVLATVLLTANAALTADVHWRWLCIISMPALPVLAVMHHRGWRLRSLQALTPAGICVAMSQLGLEGTYLVFIACFTALMSVVPAVVVGVLAGELERFRAVAETAASTDPLTGLLNRYGQQQQHLALVSAAAAAGSCVGVVLADLDRFKAVNDLHGHAAGDAVLVAVAAAVRGQVRGCDLAVRHGGEEIALVVPVEHPDELRAVAERLRRAVSELAVTGVPHVTLSAGVACSTPAEAVGALASAPGRQEGCRVLLDRLFAEADRALYSAKAAGRDRVHHHAPSPPALADALTTG